MILTADCCPVALAVMYLPVATSGYFVYGKSVKANLLQSISPGAMRMIAEILVTGHLFCGFIIIINPVCQEIEELLKIEKREPLFYCFHPIWRLEKWGKKSNLQLMLLCPC